MLVILGNAFQMTSNSAVLSKWLTLYVAETREQDGHKYPLKTLYSLLMSLSPHCCTLDSNAPNFIMSMTLTGRHQQLLNTVDLLQTALHCAIIMLMFALLYCSVLGFCILSFWQLILQHCKLSEQINFQLPTLISRYKHQHLIVHPLPTLIPYSL